MTPSPHHIALLEPYFTGSHKSWAEEYQRHSQHHISLITLPGRFWKWRMHGGAIALSEKLLALSPAPDVILATDMLDLSSVQALTRRQTHHLPWAIYFHENQLTYPWSPSDRDVSAGRNRHYSFINYLSALSADAVFFNSAYHRRSFLQALRPFLKHFPDFRGLKHIDNIRHKAEVLPLGQDFSRLEAHRPPSRPPTAPPLILWNHRWEYDKNPADFFSALYALAEQGLPFEVVLLGENFRQEPAEFAEAQARLGERIVHAGYVESFAEYAGWLWQADILPVTTKHDFFGASVVQAIYCGCYPLLPNRLVYPNLIPDFLHEHHLYSDQSELVSKLKALMVNFQRGQLPNRQNLVTRFDWRVLAPRYDAQLARLAVEL
jgi:glycosyltransferase involved in cell wall biosynthesis